MARKELYSLFILALTFGVAGCEPADRTEQQPGEPTFQQEPAPQQEPGAAPGEPMPEQAPPPGGQQQ